MLNPGGPAFAVVARLPLWGETPVPQHPAHRSRVARVRPREWILLVSLALAGYRGPDFPALCVLVFSRPSPFSFFFSLFSGQIRWAPPFRPLLRTFCALL